MEQIKIDVTNTMVLSHIRSGKDFQEFLTENN